jgi:hypothetical protein
MKDLKMDFLTNRASKGPGAAFKEHEIWTLPASLTNCTIMLLHKFLNVKKFTLPCLRCRKIVWRRNHLQAFSLSNSETKNIFWPEAISIIYNKSISIVLSKC